MRVSRGTLAPPYRTNPSGNVEVPGEWSNRQTEPGDTKGDGLLTARVSALPIIILLCNTSSHAEWFKLHLNTHLSHVCGLQQW